MLAASDHPAAIRAFLEEHRTAETRLRLATVADAELILSLRLDPVRSAHLSATSSDLAAQVRWMESYARRFEAGQEAYFIIVHRDEDVGTARLYDYRPADDSFCWGSWIIRPGAEEYVAMRSPLQIYDLAFDYLGFASAHFDIRQENKSVWNFEEWLGATLVRQDDLDRYYVFPKADFVQSRPKLARLAKVAQQSTMKIHPNSDVQSKQIGEGTRIWQYVVVLPGAVIGRDCNICSHCFIENDVTVGDRVTIKNGVQLWDGVSLENDVFIGSNATFTNDPMPRSRQHDVILQKTLVKQGASIGGNATILPGLTIGEGAMVGAGSVVTKDVPPRAVVMGNPARVVRYLS